MSKARKIAVVLLTLGIFAMAAPPALADAPGPGDKQCRGATGNGNPHCPPG